MTAPRPPRLAERLLRSRTPEAVRPFLMGDLEERYVAFARTSPRRARIWYWRQALLAVVTPLPGVAGVTQGASLGGVVSDLRHAFRSLRKRPTQALATVLTLGIGIGVVGAAFSILWGTVLRGLPFEEAERLVHFERSNPVEGNLSMAVTPHDYVAWSARQRSFEGLGAYVEAVALLSNPDAPPERLSGVRISAGTFPLLRVSAAQGRVFTEADEEIGAPPVVVLSHRLWQRRFGSDPDVVGRTLPMVGESWTVVGVMPEGFGFPIAEEFWIPLKIDLARTARGSGRLDVFGRLTPGADIDGARAEFQRISTDLAMEYPTTNADVRAVLRSFTEEYVGPEFVGTVQRLLVGAFLVLLVCCANVANLLLIRGVQRRRALAVRLSLGATRGDLVRGLLAEAGVQATLGAIIGLGITWLGVEWFNRVGTAAGVFSLPHGSDSLFWWNVAVDGSTLAAVIGATFLVTVLAGLAPALRISRDTRTLGGARSSSAAAGRGGLTDALVVGQLALTGALLVAAGFVGRSVMNVARADADFVSAGVLAARVDLPFSATASFPDLESRIRFLEELEADWRGGPEVEAAAVGTALPIERPPLATLRVDGVPEAEEPPRVGVVSVSPTYLDVFGVSPTSGRGLETRDRAGSEPVALVNQTFARMHLAGGSALGRRIRLGGPETREPWVTVVGVVPDLWDSPGSRERVAGVYLPLAQAPMGDPPTRLGRWGLTYPIVMARGRAGVVPGAAGLRATLFGIERSVPLAWTRTMEEVTAQRLGRYGVWGRFYLTFAGLALFLAALGIYGVLSFGVTLRTGEIGVRRALGASSGAVQWSVARGAATKVLVGAAVGLALGGALVGGLSRVLYGVETGDPLVYAAVAAVLVGVSGSATWLPARRAAAISPLSAMGTD